MRPWRHLRRKPETKRDGICWSWVWRCSKVLGFEPQQFTFKQAQGLDCWVFNGRSSKIAKEKIEIWEEDSDSRTGKEKEGGGKTWEKGEESKRK